MRATNHQQHLASSARFIGTDECYSFVRNLSGSTVQSALQNRLSHYCTHYEFCCASLCWIPCVSLTLSSEASNNRQRISVAASARSKTISYCNTPPRWLSHTLWPGKCSLGSERSHDDHPCAVINTIRFIMD